MFGFGVIFDGGGGTGRLSLADGSGGGFSYAPAPTYSGPSYSAPAYSAPAPAAFDTGGGDVGGGVSNAGASGPPGLSVAEGASAANERRRRRIFGEGDYTPLDYPAMKFENVGGLSLRTGIDRQRRAAEYVTIDGQELTGLTGFGGPLNTPPQASTLQWLTLVVALLALLK